jgi:3-(3-hydroxy-phenyl)propionate hydroxylase
LAWKLDAVLRGAPGGLLDSYEAERRPHVTSMQQSAVRWGGVVQTADPRVGRIRDAAIELLDRSGALSRIQEHIKPLPAYPAGAFASRPHPLPFRRTVGALFPQPDRIDVRLGRGWSVVSQSQHAARAWRHAGLRVVDLPADPWLSAHKADWALLRPDRYVFACGRGEGIAPALHALRSMIGAGLRSEQRPAAVAVTA